MTTLLLGALLLLSAGCTTFKPVGESAAVVQQRIYAGDALRPGDEFRAVTRDGSTHELRLSRIDTDDGLLSGGDEMIAINEIVSADKRVIAAAKTGGLAMGVIAVLMGGGG